MKSKAPLRLLIIIFLAIALFSGYQLYSILSEYKAGEDVYDDAAQYITDGNAEIPTASPDPHGGIVWPGIDFEKLQAVNDDVVGWIYLENSKINYPIVLGDDNSYYLNRLYDRTYNGSGSIFMDYRNSGDFSDTHTILYGHHMNNGSMFAGIAKYKQQSYYDEHPYCLILTPEQNYKLEFFAGYVASVETDLTAWDLSFDSEEDYQEWLAAAIAKSTFVSDVQPTAEDKIVTLSTCTYEFENARYVLVGVLR